MVQLMRYPLTSLKPKIVRNHKLRKRKLRMVVKKRRKKMIKEIQRTKKMPRMIMRMGKIILVENLTKSLEMIVVAQLLSHYFEEMTFLLLTLETPDVLYAGMAKPLKCHSITSQKMHQNAKGLKMRAA